MPEFQYRAVTLEGRTVRGSMIAYTPDEIERHLKEQSLYPLSVKRKSSSSFLDTSGRVGISNLIVFTVQLHSIVTSGISLLRGLEDIASQEKNARFRKVVEDIRQRVEAGEPLSKAFEAHRKVFPPFFTGAIHSGEASGTLGIVLSDLIRYLEKQEEFRAQMKQALIYPTVIVTVLSAVTVFYLTVLLPQIISVVNELGTSLPAPTRAVMALSHMLRKLWFLAPLYIGLLPAIYIILRRTRKGRYVLDSFKMRLPVVGDLVRKTVLAKFTRSLALLMKSGLDIVSSVEVLEKAIQNSVILRGLKKVREGIMEGKFLSESLNHLPFSPLILGMISVSEEAGQINTALDKATVAYEKDVDRTLKRFLSLFEPVIIVTFGLIAAGILVSVLLPIYDSITQIGTQMG
jgi:type IV pilus assembly protein PilC